jgi:hypothetical protein
MIGEIVDPGAERGCTVNADRHARDIGRRFRQQEADDAGDFRFGAHALQRHIAGQLGNDEFGKVAA